MPHSIQFIILKLVMKILFAVVGVDFPKTWTAPLDTYQEVIVTPGSPEFKEVESNFMKTIGANKTNLLEVRFEVLVRSDFIDSHVVRKIHILN